jgi:hypothetical protein
MGSDNDYTRFATGLFEENGHVDLRVLRYIPGDRERTFNPKLIQRYYWQ